MNDALKKHNIVLVKNIKESPAEGMYITKREVNKYRLSRGALLLILAFSVLLPRKK